MPSALPASRRSVLFARPALVRVVRSCLAALRLMRRWSERHRQRCDLAGLDDRLLDDIGVTRKQAEKETRKPPWR